MIRLRIKSGGGAADLSELALEAGLGVAAAAGFAVWTGSAGFVSLMSAMTCARYLTQTAVSKQKYEFIELIVISRTAGTVKPIWPHG